MRYKKLGSHWLIRLKKGEEIIESVLSFAKNKKIESGFFWGIGAISKCNLGFYELDSKEYLKKDFKVPAEVLNLTGDLSEFENQKIVHAHITLANKNFNVFGGHLNNATVAATLEIYFSEIDEKIGRKQSEEIGLKLLEI